MTRIKSLITILIYFLVPLSMQLGLLLYYQHSLGLSTTESAQRLMDLFTSVNGMLYMMGPVLLIVFALNYKYFIAKFKYAFLVLRQSLIYGFVGYLVSITLLAILGVIISMNNLEVTNPENQEIINSMLRNTNLFIAILTLGFIIPLLEELIFRIAFAGLFIRDKVKESWLPYIAMAIIFALIHETSIITVHDLNSLFMFLFYFIPAMVLSAIYKLSKHNILAVYIMHVLTNVVAVLVSSYI